MLSPSSSRNHADECDIRIGSCQWKINKLIPALPRPVQLARAVLLANDDTHLDNANSQTSLPLNLLVLMETYDETIIGLQLCSNEKEEEQHEATAHQFLDLPLCRCRRQYLTNDNDEISSSTRQQGRYQWCQSPLVPQFEKTREDYNIVVAKRKLYLFGHDDGGREDNTFHVLDLNDANNNASWIRQPLPDSCVHADCIKVAVVQDRFIYIVSCIDNPQLFVMALDCYDTQTSLWNDDERGLPSCLYTRTDFAVTSLEHEESSYLVVVGGDSNDDDNVPKAFVEAYHIQTNQWIALPNMPRGFVEEEEECRLVGCLVTTLENRYVLVAGGGLRDYPSSPSAMAFDWTTRKWSLLPSLPEGFSHGASCLVPSSNKFGNSRWMIAGGLVGAQDEKTDMAMTLDIANGIGWAKEKLLLLCFQGRANSPRGDGDDFLKTCLLETLDSGIFARILLYLFVPLPNELNCAGSIFKGRI